MHTETTPSVYAALRKAAARDPQAIALTFEGESQTYAAFLAAVDRAAARLASLGIAKGTAFAAYGQNHPLIVVAYYAAAKLGAVFVPVNPVLTAAEVDYTLTHSEAALLFHDDHVAEAARAAAAPEKLRPLSLLAEPGEGPAVAEASVSPEDPLLIIYTSGTTGTPKAVVLDHAAQAAAPQALAGMWRVSAADTVAVALPLGFLYGLSTACAMALQAGARVALLRRFHPRDVLEAMVAEKATLFQGVPTMFSMMLEYCEQRDLAFDLSAMRALIAAGSPLPLELRKRFADRFGKEIEDYFAMTEVTPIFGKYADDPRPVPQGALGRAAPGAEIEIRRPDGSLCDPGEPGELFVRGAATLQAYYKNPAQTAEAFDGRFFRTGDLGCRDAEGFYYLTGRIKDIIIRGGANISPVEVEAALSSHPAVQDVAVVGAPDRIYGEVPVAFVVARHGHAVSAEDLVAHAARDLAEFKLPVSVSFLETMPLGKTAKVDKNRLKAIAAEARQGREERA